MSHDTWDLSFEVHNHATIVLTPSICGCLLRPHENFLTSTGGIGTWVLEVLSAENPTSTQDNFNEHVNNKTNSGLSGPSSSFLKMFTSTYPCWPLQFILTRNSPTDWTLRSLSQPCILTFPVLKTVEGLRGSEVYQGALTFHLEHHGL
jgi:hypothetical protein